MKNVREIAQAVKDHLISLAIEDNLPLDMNELSVSDIEDIILAKTRERLGVDVKMKVDELNNSSEYKIKCTAGFVNAVLDVVEATHDTKYGVTWKDIEQAIIDVSLRGWRRLV